jgi:hypothetical protein
MIAAMAAGAVPAIAASDPASAVKDDIAQLANDVRSARAVLAPDLVALRADLAKHDKAAVKTDVEKLHGDAKSVLPAVQKDRKKLIGDIKAARAAGVDLPTLAPGKAKGGALGQARQLRHRLRAALKAFHARHSG